jgi:hypothetical protein
MCRVRCHLWHMGRETYRVREARTGSNMGIMQMAISREPFVENITHRFHLEIVTKFTHGFQPATVCFNFVMLKLCQLFPFSCSIADALATLIVCVFPRLPPRIPITACAHLKSGATMLTLIMKLMIQCCRLIMHYKILRSITRQDQHPDHSPRVLSIFPSFYCIEIQRPIECLLWRPYPGAGCTISSSKACTSG